MMSPFFYNYKKRQEIIEKLEEICSKYLQVDGHTIFHIRCMQLSLPGQ